MLSNIAHNGTPIDLLPSWDTVQPTYPARLPIFSGSYPRGGVPGEGFSPGYPRAPIEQPIPGNPGFTEGGPGSRVTQPVGRAAPSEPGGGPGLPVRQIIPPNNPGATTNPSSSSTSGDPFANALLGLLAQNAQGSGGAGSGVGLLPNLAPTTTTTANGNPVTTGIVVVLIVALSVGGYFLWEHYKGKIAKKEGDPQSTPTREEEE